VRLVAEELIGAASEVSKTAVAEGRAALSVIGSGSIGVGGVRPRKEPKTKAKLERNTLTLERKSIVRV
jgi:hypothetical protein